MKIDSGLFDNMVMQRNKDNLCEQKIIISCESNQEVFATLPNGEKQFLGKSNENGKCCGILKNLKVGGPYDITLISENASLTVKNIMVGDVWILAGQSNMQGYGNMHGAESSTPEVRAFYLDKCWDVAKDPIHNMEKAKAEIHWVLNGGHNAFDNAPAEPIIGVGPGVAFGKAMAQKTAIPQGLIACAHGATSLAQWSSDLKNEGENSLYGAMYNCFKLNGEKVAGVLWFQGCNAAFDDTKAKNYTVDTINLFKAIREDFNSPDLPIVLAQLGRHAAAYDFALESRWSSIREQQLFIGEHFENCAVVPTIDLELDDVIHLSGKSQSILGKRFADAMGYLLGLPDEYPPLQVDKVEFVNSDIKGQFKTIIHIKNVVGSLHSKNVLPSGFSLHTNDKENNLTTPPFRCELSGNKIILTSSSILGSKVAYAFGTCPLGNIYDEANRTLCAFGPLVTHEVADSNKIVEERAKA